MKPVNTGWHAWSSEVSHIASLTAVAATVTAVLNDALPEHKKVTRVYSISDCMLRASGTKNKPRKAENMSAGKQAGRPFPWRGERGELFQKPSKGNQKLRIPLRGKTQATQSDQTGSAEFRCGRKSGVAELMFQLEEMNDETRKDHVATKGRDLNGKKESSVPRSGEHSREQKRKVPREMGARCVGGRASVVKRSKLNEKGDEHGKEASCHTMRALKQKHGEAHMERNWVPLTRAGSNSIVSRKRESSWLVCWLTGSYPETTRSQAPGLPSAPIG
ncbi:uncharacterized protein [Ovis canadensis]|uniref:uncharacterized protein n=1 Tax=Ovis canadensis TaxID=37174 RepID=UPI003751576A